MLEESSRQDSGNSGSLSGSGGRLILSQKRLSRTTAGTGHQYNAMYEKKRLSRTTVDTRTLGYEPGRSSDSKTQTLKIFIFYLSERCQ